jgi:Amt family ammonium transporter
MNRPLFDRPLSCQHPIPSPAAAVSHRGTPDAICSAAWNGPDNCPTARDRVRTVGRALPASLLAIAFVALASPASAQDSVEYNSGDVAWMLTATALVLMMTVPGLALFYGGMVRRKNVLATAVQSFATCCLMTVLWMVVGYSLAFSDGGSLQPFVGGLGKAFLSDIGPGTVVGTIPESVFMTFQMTFAIITPALICGAFADRIKFSAMLWFMGAWSLLVYAPICHWVWGGGFLANDGVLDFAGGTVVHFNAGVAGLVAALVIGPRLGYGTENMAPHNLILSLIGASLLWVGWFGFNAGSAVAANGIAGMAMMNTQIATAAAALAWMICEWLLQKKPSVLGLLSGAVGGLVAITPAAGFVDAAGALWIGLIGGVACYIAAVYVKRIFKYDDSLDAFGIHGVGGAVGAILTGVFATSAVNGGSGLVDGNPGQILVQLQGLGATLVYCGVATWLILKAIDLTIGLRVSAEQEIEGLDLHLHGEATHS